MRFLCRRGEPEPQDTDQLHPLGQRRGSVLLKEGLRALDVQLTKNNQMHLIFIPLHDLESVSNACDEAAVGEDSALANPEQS